jgi:hypothetical protein
LISLFGLPLGTAGLIRPTPNFASVNAVRMDRMLGIIRSDSAIKDSRQASSDPRGQLACYDVSQLHKIVGTQLARENSHGIRNHDCSC